MGGGQGMGARPAVKSEAVTAGYQRSPAASGTGETSVLSGTTAFREPLPDSYTHTIITEGKDTFICYGVW
jgi:hypothetical protein